MNAFKNRNILITGASSGLGKALAIHFDQKVKRLICAGKNYNKIKSLKNYLNGDKGHQVLDCKKCRSQGACFVFLESKVVRAAC